MKDALNWSKRPRIIEPAHAKAHVLSLVVCEDARINLSLDPRLLDLCLSQTFSSMRSHKVWTRCKCITNRLALGCRLVAGVELAAQPQRLARQHADALLQLKQSNLGSALEVYSDCVDSIQFNKYDV